MIVFDVTSENSFDNISFWMKKVNENLEENKNAIIILIGNKIDLINDRKITKEEAEKVANEYNIKYFETSAKDDTGIKEAIKSIINDILENKKNQVEINNNIQENSNSAVKLEVNNPNINIDKNENSNCYSSYC